MTPAWEIGVTLASLSRDRLQAFAVAVQLGFRTVHANAVPEAWLHGPQREAYLRAARESSLTIATHFVGYDGQSYQTMEDIQRTVGLAILPLRPHRLKVTLAYSDLARELGIPSLSAHLGFLPTDLGRADYLSLVADVQTILDYCGQNGQTFHLETGQEPAAGLLEFMRAVNRPNLLVNYDPANFLLYGTDDPLTALDQLAPYVCGVHCKDAISADVPDRLGEEVPLGVGEINFPELLGRLRGLGIMGPLILERESGLERVADILAGREYLSRLTAELDND
jgi:sugar phosphate isomerase/epimerase